MLAIKDKSQIIGEFLEWLKTNDMYVEAFGEDDSAPGTERLLANYFNIDLEKVEQEKREILKELRAVNG